MGIELIPDDVGEKWLFEDWRHACAILEQDFPQEWADILEVLRRFRLRRSDILEPGGRLSPISKYFNAEFSARGWREKGFDTSVVVDEQETETPTHKVDCFKNRIALEIEWNNKDPFYDRDLNNFRLLFELRAVSVGVIITKTQDCIADGRAEQPGARPVARTLTRYRQGALELIRRRARTSAMTSLRKASRTGIRASLPVTSSPATSI